MRKSRASVVIGAALWSVFAVGSPIVLTPALDEASRDPFPVASKAIYQAAKKCWARQRSTFRSGINIEYVPGDGAVQILVKFQSTKHSQSVHPVFAVHVRPTGETSRIQAYGWAAKHPYRKMFEEDARRWAAGDYTCSAPVPSRPSRAGENKAGVGNQE